MRKHNFSAGPCTLPTEVLEKASQAVINYNDTGLSILEISHRSKEFIEIYENAQYLVKRLLNLTEQQEIFFLQGGASLQFVMVPFNLMPSQNGNAIYLDTGVWSAKAIKEAKRFGNIEAIRNNNYFTIPTDYHINANANYLHCTSNNTIYGTQINEFPHTEIPIVCDMSSDIFSRKIDYNQFSLIYAGAQKNIGPAGATLLIVKPEILRKTGRDIPSYLDYTLHIDKKGIFNTSPVFSIYVAMLNLQWLDKQGGIEEIEKINSQKSELIYSEIDRNPLFISKVNKIDRSKMNAIFYLKDENLTNIFDEIWEESGISGLRGHRAIGGYRASMYNALPLESVELLVSCMRELENRV